MCYTAPGPRCSNHARILLSKAEAEYDSATPENFEEKFAKLQEAQNNFHMTPAGQEELRNQIAAEPENGELAYKLDYGIECRKVALAQAKTADKGDVNDDNRNGEGSRIPTSEESDLTQSPLYIALQEKVNERVNSEEFVAMVAERDRTREAREALGEKKRKQQDLLEALEKNALGKPAASTPRGTPDAYITADMVEPSPEQIIEAQDRLDAEYEVLRKITDERLDSYYAYHIANDKLENFKNQTAKYVAEMNEIAGDPGIAYEAPTLGECVEVAAYDSGTREWLEERQKGIGGSDVGSMLRVDEEFQQSNWADFVKSKTEKYSAEEVAEQAEANSGFSGPTGRGNAWEPAIIREYMEHNPEATVMYSKASWAHKDNPRHKANVDGLLSSDGVTPDGILEIKTASHIKHWVGENGEELVPLGYRAQVLWYLHNTGFKYADIAVKVDDTTFLQRRIYAGESVDPYSSDRDGNDRIASIPDSMDKLENIWKDEIEARNEGTYEGSSKKTFMNDSHLSAKMNMSARQLSAWNDKPYEECKRIIKGGYNDYAKPLKKSGGYVMTRDEYMVEEFKKAGPSVWTKDRVYIDIETSGMAPDSGEIIEVGIQRVAPDGKIVFEYDERFGVKDERILDILGTGMQEVHKIAPDDIRGKKRFVDSDVQNLMRQHLNDENAVMVAHNENFEKRWFNQSVDNFHEVHSLNTTRKFKAAREGVSIPPRITHDTMWTSRYLAHHTTNNKLATFTTDNGVEYLDAHSALPDAIMTKDAIFKFDELFKSAPRGERYQKFDATESEDDVA